MLWLAARFHGDRLSPLNWLGMCVCFAGIGLHIYYKATSQSVPQNTCTLHFLAIFYWVHLISFPFSTWAISETRSLLEGDDLVGAVHPSSGGARIFFKFQNINFHFNIEIFSKNKCKTLKKFWGSEVTLGCTAPTRSSPSSRERVSEIAHVENGNDIK